MKVLRLKTHHLHTNLWVQNGHHKERSFASNYFIFFENFVSVEEPLVRSWFDVPTTWMSIFILSVSAGVLFEAPFSLWLSLGRKSRLSTWQKVVLFVNNLNTETFIGEPHKVKETFPFVWNRHVTTGVLWIKYSKWTIKHRPLNFRDLFTVRFWLQ